jgi:hypothetical protein
VGFSCAKTHHEDRSRTTLARIRECIPPPEIATKYSW